MSSRTNNWTWTRASGTDVQYMVELSQQNFTPDADSIWAIDELVFGRNLMIQIVNQFYNPNMSFVCVAKDSDTGKLLAYVWVERGQKTVWSDDEMVAAKIVHLDMSLSSRIKVKLVREMIELWETWANHIKVPVVCSTTMRQDQQAFIKLHEKLGYQCRGSICYKRLLT